MNGIVLIASIVLAVSAANTFGAQGRTHHVDAEHGEDTRDGLMPETAWRSLDKVNRAPLAPGDQVLFRRGQTWRGTLIPQSGDPRGVIAYGAYGEGNKPMLLGSAAAHRVEDWVPEGNGIWATAPLRFEPAGKPVELRAANWSLHQEGGAACVFARDKTAPDNGKALELICRQTGTRANHLQLSVTGLSVEAGAHYLFTFQAKTTHPFLPAAVSLMKSGPPYSSYAATESAMPLIGTNWTAYTVRFRARQAAGDARITLFLGGTLPVNAILHIRPGQLTKARSNQAIPLAVDVGNIIFDDGQATGVKKWQAADLKQPGDYYYDPRAGQVKLRLDAHPATLYQSIELALRRHIVDQGGRSYIAYDSLDLRYGAAHGFGGGGTSHITIRGCDISYIGGGHQFTRPDGHPVRFGNGIEFWSGARNNLVENCRLWEIYDAALTNQGDGTNVQENITYRRNVIWNSEYSFEYWNRGPASLTRNIVFEYNTCADAGHGWGHGQRPDPNGRHLMFYDNTAATEGVHIRGNIFANATDSLLRFHGRDWSAALKMDHNCWFQPKGPWLLWGKETIGQDDGAAFLKTRGFDLQSIFADPKFLNAAQRDYRLAADSPAQALAGPGKSAGAFTQ